MPGLSEKLNIRLHTGAPPLDLSKLDGAELERVLRDIDDLSIDVEWGKEAGSVPLRVSRRLREVCEVVSMLPSKP